MNHSRYHNWGEVGHGQFGKVFCGCDRATGQLFALKRLEHLRFPTHNFLKELAILVRLNHPNIVSFHGIEYQHGGRYIVMDYCQGGTLRQLLESKTKLSLVQKLGLLLDTLQGLEHIHQHRIIHCDLKPENILLDVTAQGWTAKIADFGIARFLGPTDTQDRDRSGETGSPAYMAPERFYGRFSVETDLYAVGVLLYELVTGDRPFSGMPGDVMKAHLNQPLRIPNTIPTLLKTVIRKALQKLPQHRYSSASEMRLMLETVMASLQHTHPTSVLQPLATASPQPKPKSLSKSRFPPVGPQGLIRPLNIDPLELKPYLSFHQIVRRLWWQPQGCLVATQAAEGFTLWLNTNDVAQALGTFPIPRPFLSELLNPCVDVAPQGRWAAMLCSSNSGTPSQASVSSINSDEVYPKLPKDETQLSSQLQIYRLSPFRLVQSVALAPTAKQLWIVSHCHLLVAHRPTVRPEASESLHQRLQLLNRRGQTYWTYDLAGALTAAAPIPGQPGRLFTLIKRPEPTGLFIDILPLKIKRIPLNIDADWVCAARWGYILGDRLGNIACLNRRGRTVAQTALPLPTNHTISAVTFLEPTTLIIAVQPQAQSTAQSTVLILDLSLHLPRSLLTL
jgi:serine/threonine protein kinase